MDKANKDLGNRTKQFALRIIRILPVLPKTVEARVLANQLLRSGTSVGANYRECKELIAIFVTILKHSRNSDSTYAPASSAD